ncbi:hypothetical protein GCM10010452_26510 [Crossiella cryophila]
MVASPVITGGWPTPLRSVLPDVAWEFTMAWSHAGSGARIGAEPGVPASG